MRNLRQIDMAVIRVLHFSKVINRYDFIDVIIRHADPSKFRMMASSYKPESNIQDPKFEEAGIPYFPLNIEHGWLGFLKGALRLRKILQSEKIDILHTHHFYESIIGAMACMFTTCRHVVGRHYHEEFYLTTSGIKLKLYLFVEQWLTRTANCVVVPSQAIVDLMHQQGDASDKIELIPYCFEFSAPRYQPANAAEIQKFRNEWKAEGRFVIGNFSRHHPIKGQRTLLDAFDQFAAEYPDALLLMVGDGPIHDELVRYAATLRSSAQILFAGWRRDGHSMMSAVDVVVHPSLQEAFPQVMVEVMSLGIPLIITPVSGVTDHLVDGENARVIPFNDAPRLLQALIDLRRDPARRKAIGENGQRYVHSHLTIEKVIPIFEALYRRLTDRT